MKRINIILIVLLSSMILLLGSCTEKKVVIGVSQCCGGLWREKVNKEMCLAQYQYKNVDLLFTTADDDGQRQARQIDSMIARKVDLIVVAPDNVNDVTPAIERAYRAHIPVILFDRKVKTTHYTASIGGDNVEAGREVAHFLASKLDGKGTVVEITGLKDASPVIERHRGFHEVMKNYPGIKVVTLDSNWKMERAQELMKQYLDKGGHADGVFGHNDLSAIGTFQEAERRGIYKQMLIVGIDGLPGIWEGVDRVKRGHFAASYVYPTQGEKIMELAMNILLGKPYKKDNVMKSFLATPENCDAIALQYQDLEAKMKNLDQISDSLDSYSKVSRIQKWMLLIAFIVVLILFFVIYYTQVSHVSSTRPERAEAPSPGHRPGLLWTQPCRPVRAKALKNRAIYKAFALSGRLADYHYPQGDALGQVLLGLQPVLEPHAKVQYYIYKVYRKKLQKQKAVARGFIENKEDWSAELNHLDESERYFMDRFKKKILENMGNADMKMDNLGAEMQLSKVQLYRKVKAMTGKTPAELLKEMRLQRAYTLLMQTDKTVAEVSAEVGFALPGYFSSCFRKQFGVLPTDFRNKQLSKRK